MRHSFIVRKGNDWSIHQPLLHLAPESPQLSIIFGPRDQIEGLNLESLKKAPDHLVVACSTAGGILNAEVNDDDLIGVEIEFENTEISGASVIVEDASASLQAGIELANSLGREDMKHLLVFSDGGQVNGAQLIKGLRDTLPDHVTISGGLAGDGYDFKRTAVGLNNIAQAGNIVGIGFYGNQVSINCSSGGGWDPFGPERIVTKSSGNVLHELDGEHALDVYKRYLGEQAESLPSSALKFPLQLETENGEAVVRTILQIKEESHAMVFAGEIPEGSKVRFMRGFMDDLIEDASHAAQTVTEKQAPELTICVSCVGRKLVLGMRIEEELEAVLEKVGNAPTIGFFSYGELGPTETTKTCQLHNQSISITTFSEN